MQIAFVVRRYAVIREVRMHGARDTWTSYRYADVLVPPETQYPGKGIKTLREHPSDPMRQRVRGRRRNPADHIRDANNRFRYRQYSFSSE